MLDLYYDEEAMAEMKYEAFMEQVNEEQEY